MKSAFACANKRRGNGFMGKSIFVVRSFMVLCIMGMPVWAAYPSDQVTAIVKAPYPGKNELNKCKTYADSLFRALKSKHIEAWEIYYLVGGGSESYQHAIVVYKDAGAYWYADNIFPFPTKSWGKTPLEWIEDRSNIEASSRGPVNIFSGLASYCGILKVNSTVHSHSIAGHAPHSVAKRYFYAGQ